MSAILFGPHNDDETLFCFYTMLRFKPHVIVVLRSSKQHLYQNGPSFKIREAETQAVVCDLLGLTYEQWPYLDTRPDWPAIRREIKIVLGERAPNVVIGPAYEEGGHEDHNELALILADLIDPTRVLPVHFLSYRRGFSRSTDGKEVVPTEPERMLKQKALDCYLSQSDHPQTASWFGPDQREFVR